MFHVYEFIAKRIGILTDTEIYHDILHIPMLTFIGIGLYDELDISLKGLKAIQDADYVFAEFYTSVLVGTTVERLQDQYGKSITVLSREDVEQHPDFLSHAKDSNIVFLTGGDSMVSTTHVDLRLRAKRMDIDTCVIHGSSISTAVCGLSGLQNYRFGKSATVPFPYTRKEKRIVSKTPVDTISQNIARDLHTLIFLDIDREKGYMSVNEAAALLIEMDENLASRLGVGIARAGSARPVVHAGTLEELIGHDFGEALHILIIPADLHFIEAEALVEFAGAPSGILDGM